MKPIISGYYGILRHALQNTDKKHRVLSRCRYCTIAFLTTPSNRDRHDLLCPFGCRENHKRHQSKKRSTAFYQTSDGKKIKKELNRRRYIKKEGSSQQKNEGLKRWNPHLLNHLRFIISILEEIRMTKVELQVLLNHFLKKWRQHPLFIWSETGKIPDS